MNEQWEKVTNLPNYLEILSQEVKSLTGRTMQKKATPIREGVVVIQENTTMSDLQQFAINLEIKYNIKTLQIYIHRDEGHKATADDVTAGLVDAPGEFICNNHAHMVFDWMDHTTGKSIKVNRQQMSEIQTLLAEALKMERGISSDKKHLNSLQFKEQAATRHIDEQQRVISDLHQQKQYAATELAKIEEPLTEILDATQKNIIQPLKFNRWNALQLLIAPAWKNEKIRQTTSTLEANYRQAIRAKQNIEKENAILKKRLTLAELAKKIPQMTPKLAKSIAEGQRVSMWFDDPKQGKIYADMWWNEEKKSVQYAPNQEWKNNKQQGMRPQRTQEQKKNISQNRSLHF
jgi:hypothetical protein